MKIESVVHETSKTAHRIVLFMEDSTTDDGPWTPLHEVTKHKHFYAVVGDSPLPQGVFTCKEVAHRVLG